ncbi:MAG: Sec-independent protein translocase protein TatB [Pseudomonas sp.]|jgi:sec-independent protein translocase protein TatB|nr:Sec-independent protein translocase protein TatB [Pseudomonas sp.]MDD2222195.1 Sec-independent protein translocase protein TatB [Pseudomonas sp.]MDY0413545.1 Sec-independent protein translocase protein TatB [Pseudomonas sp.]NLO54371.1 Sec-independent protein translocase subunit TatB [Gammaproteobacteria bacterium]
MFDIGFSELILIGVVALLVIGPERLPVAARVAGLWVGRIKRGFNSIKEDVERELGADEIRRELHNEGILEKERKMLKETTDKANTMLSDKPLEKLFADTTKPKDSTPTDKEQSS